MTFLEFLDSYWCTAIVSITLLVSQCISIYVLLQHLLHYNNHRLQSYVIRILVFMPIYGAITYLSHLLPSLVDILEMLSNIWEGLLIHSFLCLLMEYCGGESHCGEVISRDPSVLKHPWPLCMLKFCSLNENIPLNVGFVKRCRMGTMQYAFVRPILVILSVVFRLAGIEKWLLVSIFNSFVINVSVSLALYALGLFYLATRKHPGLEKANCLTKCVSLKLLVVFTFYQRCIIFWFTTLDHHYAESLSTFLVLVELPFFAILQKKAYCVSEFLDSKGGASYGGKAPEGDMENPNDMQTESLFDNRLLELCRKLGLNVDDICMSGTKQGMDKIFNNASMALNMTDLFSDIYYNYSDRYREHSLLTQYATEASVGDSHMKQSTAEPTNICENFAEFDKVQSLQNLEEKANTLAKLQFL